MQAVSEAKIFLLARRSQPQAGLLKCPLKFPSPFRTSLQKIHWRNHSEWHNIGIIVASGPHLQHPHSLIYTGLLKPQLLQLTSVIPFLETSTDSDAAVLSCTEIMHPLVFGYRSKSSLVLTGKILALLELAWNIWGRQEFNFFFFFLRKPVLVCATWTGLQGLHFSPCLLLRCLSHSFVAEMGLPLAR